MTEYNIVKAINNSVNNEFLGQERFYVCFADGPQVGLRENIVGYETEAKAKRRIRDLKRKEENAGVHSHLVTPQSEAERFEAAQHCEPEYFPEVYPKDWDKEHVRQVGCYPYLKKSQYRR